MGRLRVSLVLVSCLVGAAQADTPASLASGGQQQADDYFKEGRALLEADKPAEACEKFNLAIQLDATAAGTMLNLGLCNEKLGKFRTALYWFRKAQVRASETNLPDHEKAAKQHTTDLATKVATIKIAFTEPPPANVRVKIDDEDIKADDFGHAEVDPGHHVLDAGAPGKKIVHQEFDITGRGGDTLTITFVTGESSIVVDPGAGKRKTALYVAIGGGVLWAGCLGVNLWAKSKYDTAKTNGDAAAQQHYKDISHFEGTGLFIAGGVAIGAAALVYFTAPQKERVNQTVFVPAIGPDLVGFAASGRF